jgi:hypothetical protein
VELASKLLAEDRLYFSSDPRYPGLYRPRTPAQVVLDRRRMEAMRQLQHLPGHLVLVRDSNGAVRPAVAFATEGLGFHAWKVGRDGTYHHAEQLLEIISPWEFATTPPEPPREKVRLHQLTQQAKPLFRALHPLGLWEKMHAFSGALPLEALAAALSSLPFDPDSPAGRLALAWRLNACPEYFERTELEPGRGAYRAREKVPEEAAPEEPDEDRAEQNAALTTADQLFPPESGLYRRGADPATGTITLYFHFPEVARKKWQDRIAELEALTGWSVRVHPEAHMGMLSEAARKVLPEGWTLLRNPSVNRERRLVTVRCQLPPGAREDEFAAAQHRFHEETGWELELDRPGQVHHPVQPGPAPSGRMEINQAFASVKATLAAAGATVYRVGKKTDHTGDYIEVSFISPRVAERFKDVLDELSRQTGWPLKPNPEPNQHEIKVIARSLIPPEWGLKREPAFFRERLAAAVSLANPPPPGSRTWQEVARRFEELTGCTLELA